MDDYWKAVKHGLVDGFMWSGLTAGAEAVYGWYKTGGTTAKYVGEDYCVGKSGSGIWDMPEGGGTINGREYSQHAMERMAPNTPQVRAELSRRAEEAAKQMGYKVGSKEYYDFCKKYVDPRNIPPNVIENAISSTKANAGNKPGTFVHETIDVKVIVNSIGKVITVIPK